MSAPRPACLKAVRVQVEQAREHLVAACKILRTSGFAQSADELMRSVKHVQVWTQKDGWLDALERPPIAVVGNSSDAAPANRRALEGER